MARPAKSTSPLLALRTVAGDDDLDTRPLHERSFLEQARWFHRRKTRGSHLQTHAILDNEPLTAKHRGTK